MPDLIFISMENWDEVWRRNQFVCSGLARRHPGRKILFVGLARDVSHGLRRGSLSALRDRSIRGVPGLPNITVTQPLKLLPNSLGPARRCNETLARQHVRAAAASAGVHDPVLWLNPHSAVHMAGRMGERGVVYDVTDDWTSLTQSDASAALVRDQDARLCRRAEAVIVCSQRLFEMKRPLARDLHLIPNGVDAAHYRGVTDPGGPLPPEAAGWARPVLGYTGTVHPDRVDVDLVEALAAELPSGSIVLVGPDHLGQSDRARLARRGNVHLTGPVPYARVPEYMRAFDICITPHRITPFTESLNPIKLWEYLAAGKPIVATPVAGFRDFPQFVRLASTAGEFAAAALDGMREDPTLVQARRAEAAAHSWEARLDQVESVIESVADARVRSARPAATRAPGAPPADAPPVLSVVIVSYNTRELTVRCLRQLHDDLGTLTAEVFVVDNASADGSADAVAASFPHVRVIRNPTNAGFGAANNLALTQARGEFLLLLNTDAFLSPGALGALVEHLRRNPRAGAVGPRLLNADGSLQPSCFPFPSPLRAWVENLWVSAALPNAPLVGDYRRWPHDRDRVVDWAIGACLLVRREAYEQVGGFDERFFMYAEETDWQRRMRDEGWQVHFTPAATCTHLGGASGAREKARVNRHFFDSLDRYERKHHGLSGLLGLRAAMVVGSMLRAPLWAAVAALAGGGRRDVACSKLRMHAWLLRRQSTHWPAQRAGGTCP